jgi:hypothetical protein
LVEHIVDVVGGKAGEKLTFTLERISAVCRLRCALRGREVVADERDFFDALLSIRRLHLEPEGLIPFCYGSSINAWPSGMARDMGSGLSVYLMEVGRPSAGPPVSIFDAGAEVVPSLVKDQEEFAQEWRRAWKAQRST